MFVKNIEAIDSFRCNKIVYDYLKDKLPLLSKDNKFYYYAKTEKLNKLLKEAPFWIKVFVKGGD